MAEPYTHTFQIKVDNQDIEGEIEFNVDNIMTYKTEKALEGLSLSQSRAIDSLFEHFKQIFDEFGDIIKISLDKK